MFLDVCMLVHTEHLRGFFVQCSLSLSPSLSLSLSLSLFLHGRILKELVNRLLASQNHKALKNTMIGKTALHNSDHEQLWQTSNHYPCAHNWPITVKKLYCHFVLSTGMVTSNHMREEWKRKCAMYVLSLTSFPRNSLRSRYKTEINLTEINIS